MCVLVDFSQSFLYVATAIALYLNLSSFCSEYGSQPLMQTMQSLVAAAAGLPWASTALHAARVLHRSSRDELLHHVGGQFASLILLLELQDLLLVLLELGS